ncbi:MAG: hypothetical protein JSU98_07945 [Gemmatimonadales bacterium]|nr:MAG: hypothetical protein JSU98_07945 [Gemmatimonadales bacterium]
MSLAARGLRDMDDGPAPLDPADAPQVRVQARRVHRRALTVAALVTLAVLLMP